MIFETIVVTRSEIGAMHITPLGIREDDGLTLLAPYRPSTTLDNLLATRCASVNLTDDVRVFAGCLTGRRVWPLAASERIATPRLASALTHRELEVVRVEDDELRPRVFCRVVAETAHAPFRGFNRAQAAVIEAAILVSRLHMLSPDKIDAERAYLSIAIEKTAGPCEREAWAWLMDRIDAARDPSPATEDA
ncbi:MAG: DUF447 family protein [Sterolibacteriaceae bacterium]|nr:DUF447 family protein [Sterolibacteriaceae bacterium]MBK9084311.1 DUF447 family protein [Sterolibacteriaceae bacterium]